MFFNSKKQWPISNLKSNKMKKNEITIASVHFNSSMDALIRERENELKIMAVKNGKHFAKRNLPAPTGDCLAHYTGELKTGCEKLNAEIFQQLQPDAHFPEAKIDADFFKEKDESINTKIDSLQDQNINDEQQLEGFHPQVIYNGIRWGLIATSIMTIGEVLFNTKAFQVIGENLLFSLILSISVSFGVLVFSHLFPFVYKNAKSVAQKRLIIFLSLLVVTGLFTALAIFRSDYLANQDVHIPPIYFVIINLFFFIVSSLLSYFIVPSWQEIKQNHFLVNLYKTVVQRRKEIELLKKEKENLREQAKENIKERIRVVSFANYAAARFRKIYRDGVEIFKTTNLANRTDRKTPECFSQALPEPDINDVSMNLILQNRKAQ
jgi:hypothetical protein